LDSDIENAYRRAYIEIVEADPSLNLVNIVEWQSHLPYGDLLLDYQNLEGVSYQWDVRSSDSFWARHLVVCYQAGYGEAGDGDNYESCGVSLNCQAIHAPYPILVLPTLPSLDQQPGRTIRSELIYDTAISTIYVETIRENLVDAFSPKLWQYVAHEIGHITVDQGNHESGGEHVEGGLMSGEPELGPLQDVPEQRQFTAPTLLRFRETKRW